MRRGLVIAGVLGLCAGARAQEGADRAGPALAALNAKCVACHGPQLEKPKGKFGFVTDLARLAGDSTYVVPGEPRDSFLWTQIAGGEMPPKKSRSGPLTDGEREAIRAWIAAGAPVPGGVGVPVPPAQREQGAAEESGLVRAAAYLGRFHVLVIHFPIALLIAGAGAEVWGVLGRRVPMEVVRFCVAIGAAGAVVAAGLGWLHAMDEWGLAWSARWTHRWLGTAAGVVAAGVLVLSERDARRRVRSGAGRAAIVLGALLVGVAAHFGGIMTHGASYFVP